MSTLNPTLESYHTSKLPQRKKPPSRRAPVKGFFCSSGLQRREGFTLSGSSGEENFVRAGCRGEKKFAFKTLI